MQACVINCCYCACQTPWCERAQAKINTTTKLHKQSSHTSHLNQKGIRSPALHITSGSPVLMTPTPNTQKRRDRGGCDYAKVASLCKAASRGVRYRTMQEHDDDDDDKVPWSENTASTKEKRGKQLALGSPHCLLQTAWSKSKAKHTSTKQQTGQTHPTCSKHTTHAATCHPPYRRSLTINTRLTSAKRAPCHYHHHPPSLTTHPSCQPQPTHPELVIVSN